MRVAALADVHGNAPALEAVLVEVALAEPDLIVFCGDLTWGSLPGETLALVRTLEIPARFVRGNGDRAVPRFPRGLRADRLRRCRRPRSYVLLPRLAALGRGVRHRENSR